MVYKAQYIEEGALFKVNHQPPETSHAEEIAYILSELLIPD
jgi:hypothetical protein